MGFSDFERVGFFKIGKLFLKLSDFYIGAVVLKKRRESQGGLAPEIPFASSCFKIKQNDKL